MRALWCVRDNLRRDRGGDTTQIEQSAKALQTLGVEVTLDEGGVQDPGGFDLVHLFHLDRPWENLVWARRAKAASVPIAFSPIWWPQDEFNKRGRFGLQGLLSRTVGSRMYEDARLVQRSAAAVWERLAGDRAHATPTIRFDRCAQLLLDMAGVVLPNSPEEESAIRARFRVAPPVVVVPNAADSSFFLPGDEKRHPKRVICVGRIEARKNQLALVRSARDLPVNLEFIGGPGRFSASYARRVRSEAGSETRFHAHADREQVRSRYRSAEVHVCCSWYETPGLAGLEAALCGCAVVTTDRGSGRWYFGDDAQYCDPGDESSIRAAIERALDIGPSERLASRIRSRFTWSEAATATRRGYEALLGAGTGWPSGQIESKSEAVPAHAP